MSIQGWNYQLGYGPPHQRLVTAPSAPSVGEVVDLPRPLIHTSRPRGPVSRTPTCPSTLAAVLRCTTPVSTIVYDRLTAIHHLGSSHPTSGICEITLELGGFEGVPRVDSVVMRSLATLTCFEKVVVPEFDSFGFAKR